MLMETIGKPKPLSEVRVLFFGMTGMLSRIPLAILLNGGVNVCGIAVPASVLPPYILPKHGRHPLTPPIPNARPFTSPATAAAVS